MELGDDVKSESGRPCGFANGDQLPGGASLCTYIHDHSINRQTDGASVQVVPHYPTGRNRTVAPHDEGKDKYAGKNGDCRADNDRRDDGDEDEGKDLAKGRYREVGDPKTNASAVAIIGVGSSSAIAGAATAGAVVVMLLR